MNILFVCTGNTCRSPMAEGIARKILGDGFSVQSAGIAAWAGDAASKHAVAVLREQGIRIDTHLARRVNAEIMAWADWVIPMTEEQERVLKSGYPEYKQIIKRIGVWRLVPKGNLTDPWGGSLETYRRCAREIEAALPEIKIRLEAMSANQTNDPA